MHDLFLLAPQGGVLKAGFSKLKRYCNERATKLLALKIHTAKNKPVQWQKANTAFYHYLISS